MSSKDKRVMEAHRLRYMEDCSNKEVASRLGVSLPTVERYFSDSNNDKFKRFYSDMKLWRFERKMEQDVKDGVQLANNLLARAIQHEDADDTTYLRASDQALNVRKKKVELLQELGVLEKPKERVERTGGGEKVSFEMRYTDENPGDKEERKEQGLKD